MITLQGAKFVSALAPISLNSAAATALAIDTAGWHHLTLLWHFGVIGGDATVADITECDTSGGSYSAAITGSAFSPLPATATDAGKIFATFIDLRKRTRFIKIHLTTGATTLIAITGILTRGDESAAASDTARNVSQSKTI